MEWAEWTGAQKNHSEQNMPCYYGWLFSVIDADGNLYPCCFQDRRPSSAIGNIKKDNFRKLWYSEKYRILENNPKISMIDDKMATYATSPLAFSITNKFTTAYISPIFTYHTKIMGRLRKVISSFFLLLVCPALCSVILCLWWRSLQF